MMRQGARWAALLVGAGLALVRPGIASAQTGPRPTGTVADLRGPDPLAMPAQDQVVYKGTAIQGATITVGVDGPIPRGTTFRWRQVEGPGVAIDDPTAAKIRFTVPLDATALAFVATVADARGSREVRIAVPVSPPPPVPPAPAIPPPSATTPTPSASDELPPPSEAMPAPGAEPVADAGDDQVGLAGRRVVLNGSRSRPSGRVGFRWMHLSGPSIADARQEGPNYSFVPTAPGVYRFALLVGLDSKVSMPGVVSVEVGQRPAAAAGPVPAATEPASPMARWARAAIAPIPGGEETAAQVGDVFEAIAGRAALYTSFAQLQSELTRRLDVVVPSEPSARQLWSSQVFVPLSQVTAAELNAVGIDLRAPMAADRPLDGPQKERLGAFYRSLAVAFRSRPARP